MGKKIKNEIEVKATLHFSDDETPIVHIVEASVHYGTECEHGDLGRKGLSFIAEPTIVNPIKDFFENAMVILNAHEGCEPVDYGAVEWKPPAPEPESK